MSMNLRKMGSNRILLILAVACFVLAAIGLDVRGLDLVTIGLALGFASFLVR